jgi:hypothetical protein
MIDFMPYHDDVCLKISNANLDRAAHLQYRYETERSIAESSVIRTNTVDRY